MGESSGGSERMEGVRNRPFPLVSAGEGLERPSRKKVWPALLLAVRRAETLSYCILFWSGPIMVFGSLGSPTCRAWMADERAGRKEV